MWAIFAASGKGILNVDTVHCFGYLLHETTPPFVNRPYVLTSFDFFGETAAVRCPPINLLGLPRASVIIVVAPHRSDVQINQTPYL